MCCVVAVWCVKNTVRCSNAVVYECSELQRVVARVNVHFQTVNFVEYTEQRKCLQNKLTYTQLSLTTHARMRTRTLLYVHISWLPTYAE